MLKYYAIIDYVRNQIYYPTDDIDLGFKLDAMMELYTDIMELKVYSYNFGKVYVIKERVGE